MPTHSPSSSSGDDALGQQRDAETDGIDVALTYAHLVGDGQYTKACGLVLNPTTGNPTEDDAPFMEQCVRAHRDTLSDAPEVPRMLITLTPDDLEAHTTPYGTIVVSLMGQEDPALVLREASDGAGWYIDPAESI